ncbi:MAG: sorbosone dehydrogenase family protein, partial [Proteobacteria bacterium]|nr:sorbosone dehydrogenase family protein [Pseudomonadota bacterium]
MIPFTSVPTRVAAPLIALALAACGQGSTDPFAGFGASPQLPPPKSSLIPTLNARQAVGWPAGAAPVAPAGFTVTRFAGDLAHPRWLLVLPNGDVLVSEASSEPSKAKGITAMIANRLQDKAGATMASPNRITLLRDSDGDGVAEVRTTFAEGLKRPFGMTLAGGKLYVAKDDAVVAFP